jgi:hypothetical protein
MAPDVQDFPSMNMRNVQELFSSALYDSTLQTLKGLELSSIPFPRQGCKIIVYLGIGWDYLIPGRMSIGAKQNISK